MLKAIGATVVLVVAMVAVTIAFGMVLIGLLGEENSMTVGRLMWAFAFAIQVAIAVSVWRQAGARWAIPTLFLLVLIFPLYLYKQHRGMAKRTTGEPVRRFRTMATAGSLIATGILLVGLAGGIALYQHVTEPVIEGNRTIHVR